MGMPQSIIVELEEAIHSGSQDRRVETLRRITDLFLSESDHLGEEQIGVFDQVLGHLIDKIETKARVELSERIGPVPNGPKDVLRRLASDDEIAVAGPILTQSKQLTNADLVEIANKQGQQHLLAIAGRDALGEAVTDVLVNRGGREVKYRLADNAGAAFSESGYGTLVKSAADDDELTEKIGMRIDLPPALIKVLLSKATDAVAARLLERAPAETRAAIQKTVAKISGDVQRQVAAPRDFTRALRLVAAMRDQGALDEATLMRFASRMKYEEMVAALSVLSATTIDLITPLMRSARTDGLLVVCKAAGLNWSTVRAVLHGRTVSHAMTEAELSRIEEDYFKLSQPSAQRTLRFWKVRVGMT